MNRTASHEKPKIQGLTMSMTPRYGDKFVYCPARYDQNSPGHIHCVGEGFPNWRDEPVYDTPEAVATAVRGALIDVVSALIESRDANKMWGVVSDSRDELVAGLRLLRAGIDLTAKPILKVMKLVEENDRAQ